MSIPPRADRTPPELPDLPANDRHVADQEFPDLNERLDNRLNDMEEALRDRVLDPWGDRRRLLVYLAPIVGFGPAAVDLVRGVGDRRRRAVARRSVGLAGLWLVGYVLLSLGGSIGESAGGDSFSLLFLTSLWTSGYLVVCISGMVSLWRGRSLRLGPIGDWGERVGQSIAGPSQAKPKALHTPNSPAKPSANSSQIHHKQGS